MKTTVTLESRDLAALKRAKPRGVPLAEVVRFLLARVPPEEARYALEAAAAVRRGEAEERAASIAGAPGTRRDPREQLALAGAAAARFAAWAEAGGIEFVGARRWRVGELRGGDSRVRVRRKPRR